MKFKEGYQQGWEKVVTKQEQKALNKSLAHQPLVFTKAVGTKMIQSLLMRGWSIATYNQASYGNWTNKAVLSIPTDQLRGRLNG